jgi:hypothetical protein
MQSKNDKTIDKAFERLVATKKELFTSGMYRILEDAVKVALELHDEEHMSHLEIGDTYGWALMYNGAIQEIVVVSLPQNEGDALEQLYEEAAFTNAPGWVGIVMAGMHPNYFSIEFEEEVLNETISITKNNFFDYFKKI